MDNFEKVAIGILLFIATSTLAYLFKMRQLYATSPKLYKNLQISKNGSLCEVIILNRGNQVEEDICVSLDPDLKFELVAASTADISLEGSILKSERLHKNKEVSAILLIEGGTFDHSKIISISSKATSGRVIKKISEVPLNYAGMFLLISIFIGFFPFAYYSLTWYEKYNEYSIESDLKPVIDLGWKNLKTYHSSDLRKSYSGSEFPIKYIKKSSTSQNGDVVIFEIYNKTALPLNITADASGTQKKILDDYLYWNSYEIDPMSKKTVTLKLPPAKTDNTSRVLFTMKNGRDFLYDITNEIKHY